jgi:hypothetical protein
MTHEENIIIIKSISKKLQNKNQKLQRHVFAHSKHIKEGYNNINPI